VVSGVVLQLAEPAPVAARVFGLCSSPCNAGGIGAYYAEDVRISLKLPDDLLAQLDVEAKARRTTKSRVVGESLERALRTRSCVVSKSCYELASDLAGSVKGLPKDLADNPRRMEGFGR